MWWDFMKRKIVQFPFIFWHLFPRRNFTDRIFSGIQKIRLGKEKKKKAALLFEEGKKYTEEPALDYGTHSFPSTWNSILDN